DLGDVQDVVAAVVQVVPAAAHGAQRGVAGGHARECNGFFRLEGRGGGGGHVEVSGWAWARSMAQGRPLPSTATISNTPLSASSRGTPGASLRPVTHTVMEL